MLTGHARHGFKTECARCHDVQRIPLGRWVAGTLVMSLLFGLGLYVFISSMRVLWPLFELPFIDPWVGQITAGLLIIPGFVAFAWLTGKVIRWD